MAPILQSFDPLFTANAYSTVGPPAPQGAGGKSSGSDNPAIPPKPPQPISNIGEFNKLYEDLKSDKVEAREELGNDPFLQKVAIDKIDEFLRRFPNTKASPNYNEDAIIPWTDLSVSTLFKKTIRTLIDIINDLSDIISQSETNTSAHTRRSIMHTFFQKDRRLYVGFLFIFLSFVLYFIDSA
jgi:hypothetical protein